MGCGGSKPAAPPVVKSSFLEGAPNDEKELSLVWHEKLHVAAATCKMQGWRRNQEDMAIAHANFNGAPDVVFGGIFDGHSGAAASSFASEHIVPAVVKSAQWKAGDVDGALVQGFLDTDNALREAATKDGTTAICAVVGDTHLWVANCGDSRAVLCRGGAAVALSTDHKPNVPEESARIRRAGGYVDVFDPAVPRVMAPNCYMAMATSRTLGDFHFKTNKRRPQDEQIVSPRPAVVKMERQDDDQFIILASDGVWDVMSNQNVCDFLLAEWAVVTSARRERRASAGNADEMTDDELDEAAASAASAASQAPLPVLALPSTRRAAAAAAAEAAARHARESMVGALAEALLARCLAKGTMDNCSCVIIDLRLRPGSDGNARASGDYSIVAAAALAEGSNGGGGGAANGGAGDSVAYEAARAAAKELLERAASDASELLPSGTAAAAEAGAAVLAADAGQAPAAVDAEAAGAAADAAEAAAQPPAPAASEAGAAVAAGAVDGTAATADADTTAAGGGAAQAAAIAAAANTAAAEAGASLHGDAAPAADA